MKPGSDHSEADIRSNHKAYVTCTSQRHGMVMEGGETNEEHQQTQLPFLNMPSTMNKLFAQPSSQLEFVGSSMACAPHPYLGPNHVGVTSSHGPQPLVHPNGLGVHTAQIMVIPLEIKEEPVYVNAKQYHGILRRRRLRAKAEMEKKLIKGRKPYLHESRHLHAMRRARGCGGRFLNTKKLSNDTTCSNTTRTSSKENAAAAAAISDLNSTISLDSNATSYDTNTHCSKVQGFDLEADFSGLKSSKTLNHTGVGRVLTIN